jgi:hypothetical protein
MTAHTRTLSRIVIVCAALTFAASAFAQIRPPARDVTAPPTGTATMTGLVVTDDADHRPVRHALVSLSTGEIRLPMTAVTDDEGKFAFANLAAASYTLTASKSGYVSIAYGAKRPGRGLGVPIAIAEGQHVTDISVKLLRGGVITGTVRLQSGAPAVGQQMVVMGIVLNGDERKPTSQLNTVTTDDRGVYRVFGLAPGAYLVQSRPGGISAFSRGATYTVTDAEVRWASSSTAPAGAAPETGGTVKYAPVYYGGTANITQATIVTLGPAEERENVDLTTQLVPTARITGTVLDPSGQPIAGVNVSPNLTKAASAEDLLSALIGRGTGGTKADGTFALDDVAPGHYSLTVRTAPREPGAAATPPNPNAAMMAAISSILPGSSSKGTWWAAEDVDVNGQDVSNVVLRLAPGMTMSGTIKFDAHTLEPPKDLSSFHVTLMPASTGSSVLEAAASMLTGMASGTVNADGTFSVQGLTPNSYRATASAAAIPMLSMFAGAAAAQTGTWAVKSIVAGTRDITDTAFELKANDDLKDVVITMTDQMSELSGQLTDAAGKPVTGYPIIVFSTDRDAWTLGSRRVQLAQPASDGKYRVAGLPAGKYYVCAVTDLDETELYSPNFLDALVPGAFTITIADGEKKVQNLKLAGGGS